MLTSQTFYFHNRKTGNKEILFISHKTKAIYRANSFLSGMIFMSFRIICTKVAKKTLSELEGQFEALGYIVKDQDQHPNATPISEDQLLLII